MTSESEDGDLAARVAKLEGRVTDLEAGRLEELPFLRAMVDGKVAPVGRQLCETDRRSWWDSILLDVLSCLLIFGLLFGITLWWISGDRPWPTRWLQIPPPHSTELPREHR
jgi:hypothetical protein